MAEPDVNFDFDLTIAGECVADFKTLLRLGMDALGDDPDDVRISGLGREILDGLALAKMNCRPVNSEQRAVNNFRDVSFRCSSVTQRGLRMKIYRSSKLLSAFFRSLLTAHRSLILIFL